MRLKAPKIWTAQRLLILLCYTYIFGIVFGMYFYRVPAEMLAAGFGAVAGCLGVAVALVFTKKEHALTALGITIFGILLGIVNYSRVLDTSDPNHLIHFASEGYDERVTLVGVITGDPDVRERYTNIVVEPVTLQTDEGERVTPSGGLVMVRLYPDSLESYGDYEYADSILVRGSLTIPRRATNPGAFDFRKWLIERRGCYATMQVRRDNEIKKLGSARSNPLVDFALKMKEKTLESIRLTMPFPESSFLGGVTLGLQGGVTPTTRFEFQATGIAHVLSVSGLHVGFVAVLLVMLANLFKLPDNFQPPFIMASLLIFATITGASPATVRSCIMFSLFICIRYYVTGMGIVSSTLLTIPIAALAILLPNPLLVMDASFILSFGAILALGLLTVPLQQVFNHLLHGFSLIGAAVIIAALTWIAHSNWGLFFSSTTSIPIFGALLAIFALSAALQKKFPSAVPYGFSSLHPWVGAFIAAQVAINLGNTPLFALYFNRISISGWFANFIAIPLCGIIVQLGLLAGLLYTIPFVGPYLATLINGGNYLFCKFFMGSAHFFAENFPYPYIGTPTTGFSAVYYGALFIFVYHRFFWNKIKTVHAWWKYREHLPEVRGKLYAVLGMAAFAVLGLPAYYYMESKSGKLLKLTFIDVGQASATVIQTPGGKNILVDGGAFESFRNFDAGRQIVAPVLSDLGVSVLDHVVGTTLAGEHLGGLPFLCEQFHVKELIDCLPPDMAAAADEWDTIAPRLAGSPYKNLLDSKFSDEIYESYRKLLAVAEKQKIRRILPDTHLVLVEENTPTGKLKITLIVYPDTGLSIPRRSGLLKIDYGWIGVLLTGDISDGDLKQMTDTALLRADLILMPSHGASFDKSFMAAVSPKFSVIQNRSPGRRRDAEEVRGKLKRVVDYFEKNGIRYFMTEKDGAILFKTDGHGVLVKPFAG